MDISAEKEVGGKNGSRYIVIFFNKLVRSFFSLTFFIFFLPFFFFSVLAYILLHLFTYLVAQ